MHLRVAGFTIQVTSDDRDLNLIPGRTSVPFLVDAGQAIPDVLLDVVKCPPGNDGARECLFDSGGPWRLYRHDEGFLFRCLSTAFGPLPYKTALLNRDFSRGQICFHPDFLAAAPSVDPLEYPLDELLIISLLAQGRGVEIHGCGVADADGSGYLFVGQSGAGKSTMARVWLTNAQDVTILSDDRVVVRDAADGVWMYGTPWHGEEPLASPRRTRLTRVFFLRQHEHDEIVPVSRVDAVARLFAASFPPFHDASGVRFSLDFMDRLAGIAAPVELRFAPTPGVLELLRR